MPDSYVFSKEAAAEYGLEPAGVHFRVTLLPWSDALRVAEALGKLGGLTDAARERVDATMYEEYEVPPDFIDVGTSLAEPVQALLQGVGWSWPELVLKLLKEG